MSIGVMSRLRGTFINNPIEVIGSILVFIAGMSHMFIKWAPEKLLPFFTFVVTYWEMISFLGLALIMFGKWRSYGWLYIILFGGFVIAIAVVRLFA